MTDHIPRWFGRVRALFAPRTQANAHTEQPATTPAPPATPDSDVTLWVTAHGFDFRRRQAGTKVGR
ncbi:hypothetical protein [Streptomyces sp. NPDC053048]|uniref:hypothetical protein n=1 Tax=Streptomyces sp. NPDC053048 TaxID=3365694 RepID=UPI0037D5DC03